MISFREAARNLAQRPRRGRQITCARCGKVVLGFDERPYCSRNCAALARCAQRPEDLRPQGLTPPTSFASLVLVVDDDPAIRRLCRDALESDRLAVVTAGDGVSAVNEAARRHPDCVVLDLNLPDYPGDIVAAELHRVLGRAVPILLISGHPRADEWRRAVNAVAFLPKPFDLDDLLVIVHALTKPDRACSCQQTGVIPHSAQVRRSSPYVPVTRHSAIA